MVNCLKMSGTHFVGALNFLGCNKILILNTASQAQIPSIHTASILWVFRSTIACLSNAVCALVFLFPRLGVIHEEEILLVPVVGSIATWCNKKQPFLPQILSHLAITGITVGVTTGTWEGPPLWTHIYRVFCCCCCSSSTFNRWPKPTSPFKDKLSSWQWYTPKPTGTGFS